MDKLEIIKKLEKTIRTVKDEENYVFKTNIKEVGGQEGMNEEFMKIAKLIEEVQGDEELIEMMSRAIDLETGKIDMNLTTELAMKIIQKRQRKEAIEKLNEFEKERRLKKVNDLNKWRSNNENQCN